MTSPNPTNVLAKLRRHGATCVIGGLVIALAACAHIPEPPAPGQEPLVISQSTNAALQQYLAKVGTYGGAFAVSLDGENSYYVYCPDVTCTPSLYGGIAQTQCYSLSGQECYLFYVRNQPRIAYTVAPQKSSGGHHGSRRAQPLDELPAFRND